MSPTPKPGTFEKAALDGLDAPADLCRDGAKSDSTIELDPMSSAFARGYKFAQLEPFERLIPALTSMAYALAENTAALSDQCAELADALTVYRDGELAKAGL